MVQPYLLSCLHYKLNKCINSSLPDVFGPHASASPCSDLCARSSTQTISIMTLSRCLFSEQASFFSLSFKVVLIVSSWKSRNRWGVCCVVGSCYAMRKTERLGHLETPGRECWKVVCFHFFMLLICKGLGEQWFSKSHNMFMSHNVQQREWNNLQMSCDCANAFV